MLYTTARVYLHMTDHEFLYRTNLRKLISMSEMYFRIEGVGDNSNTSNGESTENVYIDQIMF